MTDIKVTAELFVSWLAGEVTGPAPEVDAVSHGPAIAEALRTRLEHASDDVVAILRGLAGDEVAEPLLERVLAECWVSIRDALRTQPNPDHYLFTSCAGRLVYLVLRLAPNAVRSFSMDEVDYLVAASAQDPLLIRHLLSWASSPSLTAEDGTPVGWTRLAQRYRGLFLAEGQARPWFDWSSEVGKDLARRLVAEVDLDDLVEVHWPWRWWTRFDLLAPLAELSPPLARTAAKNHLVLEDFHKKSSGVQIGLPVFPPGEEFTTRTFVDALRLLPSPASGGAAADRAGRRTGSG